MHRDSNKCTPSIREATLNDIRDIVEIESKSFPYPYPITLFITYLTLFPRYFLVCEYCSKIIGYVIGVVNREGCGHIVSVAVDPKFRGQGVGKLLMKNLEDRMVRDGIRRFKLEVAVSNSIAVNMYKSLGYKIVGVIEKYYPNGEDAYLMIKEF